MVSEHMLGESGSQKLDNLASRWYFFTFSKKETIVANDLLQDLVYKISKVNKDLLFFSSSTG